MVRKKIGRLTLKKRVQIETLINENKSKAYISKALKRARSSISKEINKFGIPDKAKYSAELAQGMTYQR